MRDAFETILSCIHQLFSAMLLGLMSLGFIATIGLNIYMGIMTQRCIKNSEFHLNNNNIGYDQINKEFLEHHMNSSNWIPDSLCGNSTNSGYIMQQLNFDTNLIGFTGNPECARMHPHVIKDLDRIQILDIPILIPSYGLFYKLGGLYHRIFSRN